MQDRGIRTFLRQFEDKIGSSIAEDRIVFPEYNSGDVPRMFSALEYHHADKNDNKDSRVRVSHAAGSVVGAAALVAGTTVGAGILALPAATAAAGFVPSSAALTVAWIYMTMSGLLIAELTLNRIANTGRPGLGLLELYEGALSRPWSQVGSAAYFFLHYAMMVAYIAQGGSNIDALLHELGGESLASFPGAGQLVFTAVCASALYFASSSLMETINNVLVAGVFASFLGVLAIGSQSADFGALFDPMQQHPDQVVNCFPILFLALVYQNVVPSVVTQLEGDRSKIMQAVIAGTTAPFLMFLAWNAVVLGNVLGMGSADAALADPVALLQSGAVGGGAASLGPLVGTFSMLALITSLIGFTVALENAWTDVFQIAPKSEQFKQWKPLLFGLVFVPPLALSVANPDIFFNALDYGGAFGVSTLFLVLPPLMVWKERYNDSDKPLMTKPLVPFGKLALGSMWKAAGTLILEQGAEKLGIIDFVKHQLDQFQA